jgi:hypothetical protein
MNDIKTSVKLIRPFLSKLPEKSWGAVSQEVASWLWSDLVFQQYAPINDDNYRLALEIHLQHLLIAKAPDETLKNLRALSKWLELLGEDKIVQWIKQLIRTEAPGTWYVEKYDREQSIRNVDLSPCMRDYLSSVEKRVKANAIAKLRQVLKS